MGNREFKSSFQENNWRKIENTGFRSVLYNDITLKSVEQHQAVVPLTQDQIESQMKWRTALPEDSCVVEVYEYGVKGHGLCSGEATSYAITERVHLLKNIGYISKAQAFVVLRDAAKGLDILFERLGPFTPKLNTIGINCEGRAKVWINENFAEFGMEKDEIPVAKSQLAIVNSLIRLIQSKVHDDAHFPIQYPRNLTFKAVHKYVEEVFHQLKGFRIDRVYLDRTEFAKKIKEKKQQEQKRERNMLMASAAQNKLRDIQILHENLRKKQEELQQKQQVLLQQFKQKQQNRKSEPLAQTSESANQPAKKPIVKKLPPLPPKNRRSSSPPKPWAGQLEVGKDLEMVDSMIMLHHEPMHDSRLEVIKSQIIEYKF